jgi:hypothetical protein
MARDAQFFKENSTMRDKNVSINSKTGSILTVFF